MIDEGNRWSWDEVFDAVIGKNPNRGRVKTPVNQGMFYGQDRKERSFDNKVEKKEFDNFRTPVSNNYVDRDRGHDYNKPKPQMGRNMLIPQEESQDDIKINPIAKKPSKDDEKLSDDNPRFFYFILV